LRRDNLRRFGRLKSGTLDKKKTTISCQPGWDLLLFFRKADKPGWRFPDAARNQGFGGKDRE
jgi:hypothetical protein